MWLSDSRAPASEVDRRAEALLGELLGHDVDRRDHGRERTGRQPTPTMH